MNDRSKSLLLVLLMLVVTLPAVLNAGNSWGLSGHSFPGDKRLLGMWEGEDAFVQFTYDEETNTSLFRSWSMMSMGMCFFAGEDVLHDLSPGAFTIEFLETFDIQYAFESDDHLILMVKQDTSHYARSGRAPETLTPVCED
jgi:hypothetical protein